MRLKYGDTHGQGLNCQKKDSFSVISCAIMRIKVWDEEVTAMELSNCYRCGRLFAKAFRDLCPNCLKDIEVEYTKCVEYLRKERKSTIIELSEATGVSVNQITKFMREGRISIAELPNMSYSCETCGGPIREGNICDSCRRRLLGDLQRTQAQRTQDGKAEENGDENRLKTYRTSDKD